MDEESKQKDLISDGSEDVTLYSLFSNPIQGLIVFIGLFLLAYYVVSIYSIVPVLPKHIRDSETKSVMAIQVDISDLNKNRFKEISWHGLPIGIYKRTDLDFEEILKRHPKQIKPEVHKALIKQLSIYLMTDVGVLDKDLRSIKDEYFVFIMLSPYKGCPLNVIFYHDAIDQSKNQYANIYEKCSLQKYDMNGKLSLENFYGYDTFRNKLHTNFLLIPNHKFINDNTIEFSPNNKAFINDL